MFSAHGLGMEEVGLKDLSQNGHWMVMGAPIIMGPI